MLHLTIHALNIKYINFIMKLLKKIALICFDWIDKYYHQKKIKYFLKKNKFKVNTFFDIGAHLGNYTDLILEINDSCRIFMFEPQTEIFKKIKDKYKGQKKINTFNYAISNKNGFRKFFVNKHDLTSTFSKYNHKNAYLNFKAKLFNSSLKEMTILENYTKTMTLKRFINEKKLNEIDLVKIDTEGHELEVINGIGSKITNIKCLIIEFHHDKIYHSYNCKKIHNYLIKKNFIFKHTFPFPLSPWEDRLYLNKKY